MKTVMTVLVAATLSVMSLSSYAADNKIRPGDAIDNTPINTAVDQTTHNSQAEFTVPSLNVDMHINNK